jgi:hypothetical protein
VRISLKRARDRFQDEIQMALARTMLLENTPVASHGSCSDSLRTLYAAELVYGGVTCSEDDCPERETRR